jgi:hypothetical protein
MKYIGAEANPCVLLQINATGNSFLYSGTQTVSKQLLRKAANACPKLR